MKKFLLIGLSVVCVSLPATARAASEWMSSADIMRELVDQELSFRGKRSGKITYHKSGQMRMLSGKGRAIFGKWRIDGESDRICSRVTQRKTAREFCYRTRHDGFGYRTDQGYKLMPLRF